MGDPRDRPPSVSALIDTPLDRAGLGWVSAGRRRGGTRRARWRAYAEGVLSQRCCSTSPTASSRGTRRSSGRSSPCGRCRDVDAAFEVVNASRYGLQASVFTECAGHRVRCDRPDRGRWRGRQRGARASVPTSCRTAGSRTGHWPRGSAVCHRGADRDPDGDHPAVSPKGSRCLKALPVTDARASAGSTGTSSDER